MSETHRKLPNLSRLTAQDAVRAYAQHKAKEAVETLAEIMADKDAPASVRVSAATALLDRAVGKPAATIETRVDATDMKTLHLQALKSLSVVTIEGETPARVPNSGASDG
jgi:hypothetical protein